ncbi:MAG: helix-turn-helix transcriptional regulator [Proteobacteria bacterium]|nr:helix-turn-helix transcriptional regulator [Pseudomonadota bacterium]
MPVVHYRKYRLAVNREGRLSGGVRSRGRMMKTPTPRPDWAVRLAETRQAAGYTSQERFAEAIGKSQSSYAAYETGQSEPDHATWRRIASALDVSPGWLVFGVGHRNPDQGDANFWNALEANKDDLWLPLAIERLSQMLAQEKFAANAAFIFQLGMKVSRELEGVQDHAEGRQRIEAIVNRERAELRKGLERLRKSLL